MNREYYQWLWIGRAFHSKGSFWNDLSKEEITDDLLEWLEEILPQNPKDRAILRIFHDERLLALLNRKGFRPFYIGNWLLCNTKEEFLFLNQFFSITGEEICQAFETEWRWKCRWEGELEEYFTPILPLPTSMTKACLYFKRKDLLDTWNGDDGEWKSLIHYCQGMDNVEMLDYLLSRFSVPERNWHELLYFVRNKEVLRVFLRHWGKKSWKEGNNFLHNREFLSVFLEEGASPFLYLQKATESCVVSLVEFLLLKAGSVPQGQIEQMWLHVRSQNMTKYLSQRYPCPSSAVLRGLLLRAINRGDDKWAKALLEGGAVPGKKVRKACQSILNWMQLLKTGTGKKFLRKLTRSSFQQKEENEDCLHRKRSER